jgi:hypothetical protein
MIFLKHGVHRLLGLASPRGCMLLALAALVSLLPTSALAAGGENVVLNF